MYDWLLLTLHSIDITYICNFSNILSKSHTNTTVFLLVIFYNIRSPIWIMILWNSWIFVWIFKTYNLNSISVHRECLEMHFELFWNGSLINQIKYHFDDIYAQLIWTFLWLYSTNNRCKKSRMVNQMSKKDQK